MTIKKTVDGLFKASRAKPIAMVSAALAVLGIASFTFGRRSPALRNAAKTVGNLPIINAIVGGLNNQVSSDGNPFTFGR